MKEQILQQLQAALAAAEDATAQAQTQLRKAEIQAAFVRGQIAMLLQFTIREDAPPALTHSDGENPTFAP